MSDSIGYDAYERAECVEQARIVRQICEELPEISQKLSVEELSVIVKAARMTQAFVKEVDPEGLRHPSFKDLNGPVRRS